MVKVAEGSLGRAWANDSETGLGTSAGLRSDFPNPTSADAEEGNAEGISAFEESGLQHRGS